MPRNNSPANDARCEILATPRNIGLFTGEIVLRHIRYSD